jgi:uncharacterized membrane protein
MNMKIATAAVVGCVAALPILGIGAEYVGSAATLQGRKGPKAPTTEFATLTRLPSLGSNAEAHGVNDAGTVVVGHSFDRAGYLYAVKWTLHNGVWVVATLPYAVSAARANGVASHGDVVGWVASFPRYPALWPAAGGYTPLGCANETGEAQAISADGQLVVGQNAGRAVAWPFSSYCAEYLQPLAPGVFAAANAVNADGTIIGGTAARIPQAASLPVRWTGPARARLIEELDSRPGRVWGANAAGDLAGYVSIPCALEGGCHRAAVWYAAGGATQLETLGGAHSWGRGINAQQEMVGMSTSTRGVNTAFFWSESIGMIQMSKQAVANGVSDVRPDGTRLVVGMDAQANAAVWVVRKP